MKYKKNRKKHTNHNCGCASCKSKRGEYKGKNNPNFRGDEALTHQKYFCINNCGNEISYSNWKYGKKQCSFCYNNNFKDGRTSKKYYCIDCGKETSGYRAKRCILCSNRGKNNPNYGNHTPKKNKHINPNCQCASCKSKRGETRGKNNPMYNKNHTIKTKEIISIKNKGKLKGENNPNWQNGISNEPYPFEFDEVLKEEIRKRDNYKCQGEDCKLTNEEHLIIYNRSLSVHHIDYDKKNCNENNLISVCQQCNTRANFNREYWKKYYQDKLQTILKI